MQPVTIAPVRPIRVVQPPDLTIGDLADRLRFANEDDTCKGMFFNGVLSAAEKLLGPIARAQVAGVLPEKKYVDFFNYPIATFLPAAFAAAKWLHPQVGDFDAGMRKLGEQAIDDFLGTAVGRTLVTVSAGEPRRLMRAAPIAYKTAVSYGTRDTVFTSETTCVFKMRRDFMPHPYHEGVFTAVLRALGCHDVEVKGRCLGLMDADYDVSWR
ncbi:MAG: DUF2378 family protein [Archangiaceae bacterium]|nr:DUF2378 family protein [Archangiaceae bacterium]